jgi:hypothetical protein
VRGRRGIRGRRRATLTLTLEKIKNDCLIDLVGDVLQSAMTYVYIGSRAQLFESDMTKCFLNKQNFKPYLDSTLSVKTRPFGMGNQTIRFLQLWLFA